MVADIASDPLNRGAADDLWGEEFDEQVATIGEHGVLQPIVVCSAEAFRQRLGTVRRGQQG